MRLFLIRHGETVDNVAGLYAGSRDSPLTAHGVLQARRLAGHLASRATAIGPVAHIFASDLQRAYKTAEALLSVQESGTRDGSLSRPGAVVKVADLRERDFRSSEGTRFGSKPRGSDPGSSSGTGAIHLAAETREEMEIRVERFIEIHLQPIFDGHDWTSTVQLSVVVVAHGIILNVLLRSLLVRFAPLELARLSASVGNSGAGTRGVEYLTSWSNTGYLEAVMRPRKEVEASSDISNAGNTTEGDMSESPAKIGLAIAAINCVEHLQGLKKTRGGIGSAKFDEKQKTMDSFFGPSAKRQKK